MYGPQKESKSVLFKLGVVLGVVAIIVMLGAVGWLIVKVTQTQSQPTAYSDESSKKDNGTGISLGDAKSNATSNDISLQDLTQPNSGSGQSSTQGSSGPQQGLPVPGSADTAQTPKPVRSQNLPNGLKIDEYTYGAGDRATKFGDTIAVHYVGYLTNGQVFDTSLKGEKKPFAFKLGAGSVIQGWDIGLQDMHVGAVRRLTIPAALAYGAKGYPPTIPPNSTLIFDVQLMGMQ